jgi:hypothetical protein
LPRLRPPPPLPPPLPLPPPPSPPSGPGHTASTRPSATGTSDSPGGPPRPSIQAWKHLNRFVCKRPKPTANKWAARSGVSKRSGLRVGVVNARDATVHRVAIQENYRTRARRHNAARRPRPPRQSSQVKSSQTNAVGEKKQPGGAQDHLQRGARPCLSRADST